MSTLAFPSLYRHNTPPTSADYLQPHSAGSTHTSSLSFDSSPVSDITAITTPPRSPKTFRQHGSVLLPKIRPQDQHVDHSSFVGGGSYSHRRNTSSISTVSNGFSAEYISRMPLHHRSVSPPSSVNPLASMTDVAGSINFGAPLPPQPQRARSMSRGLSNHSRSSSLSNIDEAAIRKYICPTQRGVPLYMPSSLSQGPSGITATTTTTPSPVQATDPSPTQPLPALLPSYAPAQPQQTTLPPELCFENYSTPAPETTLMDYLTAPNPSPALVRRNLVPNRTLDTHFWWDVRNVRAWTAFSTTTIHAFPGLGRLLEFPLPQPGLPTPPPTDAHPETTAALADAHAAHYLPKVNAALKAALGDNPLSLRANKTPNAPGARAGPDFLANHPADYERTAGGAPRSRVVGLVRTFDGWDTGKRSAGPAARIDFLRELAALHRHMREHHTRYGFIVTEIELVCVRAGADDTPFFGLLELAPPVRLEAAGRGTMTAPLALWYLCMLAKNTPLPGQPGWRMDVGAPAALTRQNCLERDVWMVAPEGREKRDAKRNRGWVECTEPLSRKEVRSARGRRG